MKWIFSKDRVGLVLVNANSHVNKLSRINCSCTLGFCHSGMISRFQETYLTCHPLAD